MEVHLAGLFDDAPVGSDRFTGGQSAADAALLRFTVSGYASSRNEVHPAERRGASGLSPWIRHGLLSLPRVWDAVEGGPSKDVRKFRDELLWQEYARHLYARVGRGSGSDLRMTASFHDDAQPWPREMACVDASLTELERDGWLVNQSRMWLASDWAVRHRARWQDGEDYFFRHLLDGSRAANRLGWQWVAGRATGRPYGFSRQQVERRAPGLCRTCPLSDACPIADWPEDPPLTPVDAALLSRHDGQATAGPAAPRHTGTPDAVWLTAESLGDADPALSAHPDLPAVFVFDAPLLSKLRLSAKRLIFLAEALADLGRRRAIEVRLGHPTEELAGRPLATTFAPVPGFRSRATHLDVATLHPWPWLVQPNSGSVASFSAWRRSSVR
ncbi:MAG: deoxyribodipyrimidine photolyase [Acidimicrobiia bacterium]|nr:deoxyribodipyrimidine photolyase [Acidimicrobiia bacterium]